MNRCGMVIGKNFGDEGKGAFTAALSKMYLSYGNVLNIKHNGGGQAGHTVELGNFRHIFHTLGSGSVWGADTYLADTFIVDLIKLEEEIINYNNLAAGFGYEKADKVYAAELSRVSTIYDVLINEIKELLRGRDKHGSCGMGIYETVERDKQYRLRIKDIDKSLPDRLADIRDAYALPYVDSLLEGRTPSPEVLELVKIMKDENVLYNSSDIMLNSFEKYVDVISEKKERELSDKYESIIFESGQGLMLDMDNEEYFPHLTPSKTGSCNPVAFLKNIEALDVPANVYYITRTYVTRHGAGQLLHECAHSELPKYVPDKTNGSNPWQDSLRYAKHGTFSEFMEPVYKDGAYLSQLENVNKYIVFTHLDETESRILTVDGLIEPESYVTDADYKTLFV